MQQDFQVSFCTFMINAHWMFEYSIWISGMKLKLLNIMKGRPSHPLSNMLCFLFNLSIGFHLCEVSLFVCKLKWEAVDLGLATPRFNYVAAAEENPWLEELDLEDG